jgi:hypothetical protein
VALGRAEVVAALANASARLRLAEELEGALHRAAATGEEEDAEAAAADQRVAAEEAEEERDAARGAAAGGEARGEGWESVGGAVEAAAMGVVGDGLNSAAAAAAAVGHGGHGTRVGEHRGGVGFCCGPKALSATTRCGSPPSLMRRC